MKIVLDDGRIAGIIANGDFVAAFSFLSSTIPQHGCCGRVTGHRPDFENIRKHIASLPDDQKTKLKQMLQAEEVTIHYNDGTGVKPMTF